MAQQGSQQKTEKPTPKRLRDARKKGQVAFSKDANSTVVFIVAIAAIGMSATLIAQGFVQLFSDAAAKVAVDDVRPESLPAFWQHGLKTAGLMLGPMLVVTAAVGLLFGLTQTRFVLSFHPMKPELNKLSPMKRLKQWFSVQGLFDYAKTWVKLLTVFLVGYLTVFKAMPEVLRLGFADSRVLLAVVGAIALRFLIWIAIVFLFLAALDFLFQRWKWTNDLKMSKHDVKQEYKQTEGDPLIKSKRKSIHRQLSLEDIRAAVGNAQVVLVNPTHLAVVLHYDKDTMPVPMIAAKGREGEAQKIRDLADELGTPVIRNVPLARALIQIEVAHPIPRELYVGVAEVLKLVSNVAQRSPGASDPFRSRPAGGSASAGRSFA